MYFSVDQLRQIEAKYLAAGKPLMASAGLALANFVSGRFGTARPVLCLVGPGNNGGDALVCATHLLARGHEVVAVMPDAQRAMPPDADAARTAWLRAGGALLGAIPDRSFLLVLDGLFGIGLNRVLDANWQALIDQVNALACPVLSVDVPSGVQADSGALLGRAIRATWTMSFIGRARGLATGAALDYVGEHLLEGLQCELPLPRVLQTHEVAANLNLTRSRDSHKGAFGTLHILGGADGMVGAALLAGRAALGIGAGKVRLGLLTGELPVVDWSRPELMLSKASACLAMPSDVLVIGPGMGQGDDALALLQTALSHDKPLLLDADALNWIASEVSLAEQVCKRAAPTVITPHPSEAARLLGCTTVDVQNHRYHAAEQLAARLKAVVVLKGAGSIVCGDGKLAVNATGSAALANAGQGDVLSGMIGGLLAQGLGAWEAANLGCYLHGAASDYLVGKLGRRITLAAEVIDALHCVMP